MNKNVVILRVKPTDWKNIKTELVDVETRIFGQVEGFEEEDFAPTFKNPKAYNIIVYSSGRIVGYLMSQKLSDSNVHGGFKDKDTILYLESVGLLKNYQGHGIGKRLILSYLAYGKRIGCKSYLLDTREKSMIKLAEAFGFKKERYNAKHNCNGKKWVGAWIMVKTV